MIGVLGEKQMAVPSLDRPEELTLVFDQETLKALEALATVAGHEGPDRLAALVRDALRVYEWILHQQVKDMQVAALDNGAARLLVEHPGALGVVPLARLFSEENKDKLREYFQLKTD